MVYVIDIDATICESTGADYASAVPFLSRIEKINKLFDNGDKIIYYTARGSSTGINWRSLTASQLRKWGCKYNELRMGKLYYDKWVDDKAINSEDFFGRQENE